MTSDQTENTPLLEVFLTPVALSLPRSTVMGTTDSGIRRWCKAQLEECPNVGFGEGDNDKILQDGNISVDVIWNQWMHH